VSVLVQTPTAVNPASPPGKEIGAETQWIGGLNGWAAFADQAEFVPALAWPQSINTYHSMRSDSQVDALHIGTVQPVREFRWSIDPNKAPASLVEQAASDLGLPIRGEEDDAIKRGPRSFDFDQFLDDVLLAPLYGHFHHEIVGHVEGGGWRMDKLAPRHPRTIMEFQSNAVGDLLGIRQNIAGAAGWNRLPEPIPAGKLITHVWRREAGNHTGRSMLRSIYREWAVKDRVIRVAAINLERGGGVPVIEGPQGASDAQLRDLATMARQFKSAEGGGGAVPFGSKLTFAGASVPDAVGLLQYCDNCMARVWALMLVQLGTNGGSGNRALGQEFSLFAARAQRAIAKWVCRAVNRWLDDYTEWNTSGSNYAPVLHFEQEKPDSMSVAELVALLEAEALHVDPELEDWLRSEHGLPPAPEPQTDPTLGDLTPEEVSLIQNSRNPVALPPGQPATGDMPKPRNPPAPKDPSVQEQTLAAAPNLLTGYQVPLPARQLRRLPTAIEARARTDYRAMDLAHQTVLGDVQSLMRQQIIPQQVKALGEQIETKALTKAAMAGLQAPVLGADDLAAHLMEAARQGAHAAAAELAAQGAAADIPDDAALSGIVGDQAKALAEMAANGISLAAQRRAQALVGAGRSSTELRTQVETSLNEQKHQWTMDQLNGAVQLAQNAGRGVTFATASQTAMRYFSSEILDQATCLSCVAVDGTEYPDLQAAMQDYAAGGYVDCAGGPRCRGTIIGVYQEVNPLDPSAAPDLAVSDLGTG
jgi:hypothetical protein